MGSCNGLISDDNVESYGSILLECCESPNALSSTLRVLNVTNTGVTSTGVFFALEYSKHLQSVGDYPQMGRVLELVVSKYNTLPKYQLKNATITVSSAYTIDLITKLCPVLEQLTAIDTRFLPKELSASDIPSTLKSLILLGIPPHPLWLSDFNWFLNEIKNVLINELVLKFFATEILISIEIGEIIKACPFLKILVIDGADINWSTPLNNKNTTLLEKVQLGQIVTRQVVMNLIMSSPNLSAAHFYNCPDITQNDIISFISTSLKCFFIYETRLRYTSPIFIQLLHNCSNLQYIGNITNWGGSTVSTCDILKSVKEKNYNLEFFAGSHWYNSICINKYE